MKAMNSERAALPAEALTFLRQLKDHNDRDWFAGHKAEYEAHVKAPLLLLAGALSEALAPIAPAYASPSEKAVRRIYRDIRFSPNKTPYRTELEILFAHRDLGKQGGTGLYISISPERLQVIGGLYWQEPAGLHAVRQYLFENVSTFQKILAHKAVRQTFGALTGEQMKRPPRGFAPTSPAIDLLQRTQWLLQCSLPPETITKPDAAEVVSGQFRTLLPFVQFFEPPLLARMKPVHFD